MFDGTVYEHWVEPLEGDRWSLAVYKGREEAPPEGHRPLAELEDEGSEDDRPKDGGKSPLMPQFQGVPRQVGKVPQGLPLSSLEFRGGYSR